jgi:putative ABC transport system ATP-binding protein
MTAVRCVDLCKTYRQGDQDIKALDHVSIEIEKGGFVCLSAPSGGGKTTLLNAIGGLDIPDSGEVYIAGERIDNLSKGELADLRLKQIGFVFQAYNLIPVLSAIENVEFVMQVQGVAAAERNIKARSILREVGLAGPPVLRVPPPLVSLC